MHDDCDSSDEDEDCRNKQISDSAKINGCDLRKRTSLSDNHGKNYKKQTHALKSPQKAEPAASKQSADADTDKESNIKVEIALSENLPVRLWWSALCMECYHVYAICFDM